MKQVEIKGIIPPILTPMNPDETVNTTELRAQVDRMIENGCHALFPFGTNGEGYILTAAEKQLVLETVIEQAAGRVPVYAGTGCISTRETIEQSRMAQRAGADVLSIITPSFAAASQEELYRHYATVAEAVDLPIVLYNIPARTGNALAPATVARLAQIENIVGAKDSSGNFANLLAYIDAGKTKTNGRFSVLSGNDQLIIWTLLAGGTGGIAGCANVYPHTMASIYNLFVQGKVDEAIAANVLLLIVVMLGASVMGNTTGYYMLVLTIVASIPYNKNLPNSKLLMPLGFATGRALIPVSVAFFMGLASSLLESSNYENTISMAQFSIMMFIMSIGYLLWALIAYRFLPDHDVSQGANSVSENEESAAPALPKWKEYCTYGAFLVSVAAMFLLDTLGQAGYILPCLATAFLCLIGVFNFKEVRANVFSPLILMMASVIGVAGALADTGFTAMVGEAVANAMGGNVNPFVLVLVFCLLTSACATLTGASIGALFIFAPIGIATCMSLGLNPTGLAAAMTAAAWGGGFLPIDGLPAMILGMGKYKLSQFFKYALPMYFIQILALAIGAMVAFPM